MGNNSSNEYNICDEYKNIKSVKGLESDSASDSDIWIVTFNNNAKGFIKIFLNFCVGGQNNPKPCMKYLPLKNSIKKPTKDNYRSTIGLRYESQIYNDVVKPILKYKLSPNFIKPLFSGYCNSTPLVKILMKNGISKKKSIEKISRNVLYMADLNDEEDDDRPSITDPVSKSDKLLIKHINLKDVKVGIIINESIDKDTKKLSSYIGNEWKFPIRENMFDILGVVFQCICAIKVLSMTRTVHQDLHTGNIYVKKLRKPQNITYIFNSENENSVTKYTLKNQSYIILLYDFDRSYSERFGYNNSLKPFESSSQTNRYIENKDIIKFFCYLYKRYRNFPIVGGFPGFLSKNPKQQNFWRKNVYTWVSGKKKSKCFLKTPNYKPVTYRQYLNTDSTSTIIQSFANILPSELLVTNTIPEYDINIETQNLYIALNSFFKSNGDFNIKNINEFYSQKSCSLSSDDPSCDKNIDEFVSEVADEIRKRLDKINIMIKNRIYKKLMKNLNFYMKEILYNFVNEENYDEIVYQLQYVIVPYIKRMSIVDINNVVNNTYTIELNNQINKIEYAGDIKQMVKKIIINVIRELSLNLEYRKLNKKMLNMLNLEFQKILS